MLLMEFGLTLADILDSTISKASVQLYRTTVVPRTSQATPLSRRPQMRSKVRRGGGGPASFLLRVAALQAYLTTLVVCFIDPETSLYQQTF